MANVKMMQGDSYYIFFDLTQNGTALTPDIIEDVEVCVGEELRYLWSSGSIGYDTSRDQYYFRPTQAETLALDINTYDVVARIKYSGSPNADVRGVTIGRISITDGQSTEVI